LGVKFHIVSGSARLWEDAVGPQSMGGGEKSRLKNPGRFSAGLFAGAPAVRLSSPIDRNCAALRYAASTSPIVFKLSRPLIAGSCPVSRAMSSCAIVPINASGNQLSVHTG